jgi:hypothetical protein
MEPAESLKLTVNEPHLKLVKNTQKEQSKRIYINNLMPNFSYKNKSGEILTPKKCALL